MTRVRTGPDRGSSALYVAVDGPDGSGKSSQVRWLCEHLDALGDDVLLVREPGATALGERLRAWLLEEDDLELGPLAEAMLFVAARAELVRSIVVPALAEGRTVVSDRCFASTLVYQCLAAPAGGEPGSVPTLAFLLESTRAAHALAMPAVVYVLDVTAKTARQRRARRAGRGALDRFEARAAEFHERVCESFRALATRDDVAALFGVEDLAAGGGVVRVDAEASSEEVQRDLRERVLALGRSLGRWA